MPGLYYTILALRFTPTVTNNAGVNGVRALMRVPPTGAGGSAALGAETLALCVAMGLILWAAMKLIAAMPSLLTNVKACRGDWAEARLRKCELGIEFTGIPVEPLNSYSNLAYFAAGWVTLRIVGDAPSIVLGATLIFLSIGSTMYHGVKSMWGFRLDHAGMYAVFAALALYAIAPNHHAISYVMAGGALVAAVGFAFFMPGELSIRMGLLLAVVSVRAFLLGRPVIAGVSLGVFALAEVCWQLDKRTTVLGRFGHAIWHLATAAAISIMFMAMTT